MKTLAMIFTLVLFFAPVVALAQSDPKPATAGPKEGQPEAIIAQQSQSVTAVPPGPPGPVVIERRMIGGPGPGPGGFETFANRTFSPGLGAWWKNSEIVSKLQLSQEQVKKISETFLNHKLKLIDLQADVEKQELRLEPLLDVDQPDAAQVGAQIDLITGARGKLEKENAMMMLDIRRWLSVEQWKKLKALQTAEEGKRNVFYMRTGPGGIIEGPPAPPLPGDLPVRPPAVLRPQ